VIALAIGEAEGAFLEDRIRAVPEGYRKAQKLLVVTKSREAVLTPAIYAAACVVVREIIPSVSVLAVVLADGAPLSLAKIRAPLSPGRGAFANLQ
jgi:hypothetical protein